ncbi:DUF1413 domain-containing protein [Abyssisolibacter fermentans]|uniref:DUF1413 domain-containing protein n=1 Tax=Abyssisolibacter fermentans TaxID=1766203 RepID=UPI00082CE64A|nr:DUF1413 domain-containing protein [Abyssisolibacter fermentans]
MAQITLRVSESDYKKLQSLADESNLTLTDFLLSSALPNYLGQKLTVNKVLERLSTKSSGDVFSLKDLFTSDEWSNFTPGSRISTGRIFYKSYTQNEFNLKNKVSFEGKNSANLAFYKKL